MHTLTIALQMNSAGAQGRSDDTNSIKGRILRFIPKLLNAGLVPPLSEVTKTGRGFDHPQTAFYLMPARWVSEWKKDADG